MDESSGKQSVRSAPRRVRSVHPLGAARSWPRIPSNLICSCQSPPDSGTPVAHNMGARKRGRSSVTPAAMAAELYDRSVLECPTSGPPRWLTECRSEPAVEVVDLRGREPRGSPGEVAGEHARRQHRDVPAAADGPVEVCVAEHEQRRDALAGDALEVL